MYAIIETGGKQYKVTPGDTIYVEKLPEEGGDELVFDKVLAVFEDDKVKFGAPYVAGVSVAGRRLKDGKAKKILVFKYKAKKNYRKRQGHRQPYTKVEITQVKLP